MNLSSLKINFLSRKPNLSKQLKTFITIALVLALIPAAVFTSRQETNTRKRAEEENQQLNPMLNNNDKILELTLDYDEKATPPISLNSFRIINGQHPRYFSGIESYYYIAIKDSNQAVISKEKILAHPLLVDFEDNSKLIPEIAPPKTLSITLPYSESARYVQIIDEKDNIIQSEIIDNSFYINNPKDYYKLGELYSPSQTHISESGEPESLNYNALRIAFIGDGFTENNIQDYRNAVNEIRDYILNKAPFNIRQNELAFYSKENITVDLECYFPSDRLVFCNWPLTQQVLNNSGTPYDKIIILFNDARYGGAGFFDGIGAVTTMHSGRSLVATHELGHTLGLEDEYVYGSPATIFNRNCYNGNPPNPAWAVFGNNVQYYQGCKNESAYRSSENSIMRSWDNLTFNTVSQYIINNTISYYSGGPTPPINQSTPTPTPTPTVTPTPTLIPVSCSNSTVNPSSNYVVGSPVSFSASYSTGVNPEVKYRSLLNAQTTPQPPQGTCSGIPCTFTPANITPADTRLFVGVNMRKTVGGQEYICAWHDNWVRSSDGVVISPPGHGACANNCERIVSILSPTMAVLTPTPTLVPSYTPTRTPTPIMITISLPTRTPTPTQTGIINAYFEKRLAKGDRSQQGCMNYWNDSSIVNDPLFVRVGSLITNCYKITNTGSINIYKVNASDQRLNPPTYYPNSLHGCIPDFTYPNPLPPGGISYCKFGHLPQVGSPIPPAGSIINSNTLFTVRNAQGSTRTFQDSTRLYVTN